MGLIGRLLVKLGVDNSDFKQGLEQSSKQTGDFTGKISGMFKKLAGGIAVGAVLRKAFDFGKEAFQAAAAAQGVKVAFDRLNDPNLLNNLKTATKETVDELKLMQLSVQAKNFRLPVDQLSTYLGFATKRAQETGMSVDYLTNSIITGLGRKSVLILDNLGISAVEIREEMKKGGDMAQAVGRIIQREMAKAGDVMETAAMKAARIDAKWSDFKGNLGNTQMIQKAGNAIQDFLISALNKLNDLVTSLGNSEVQSWIANVNLEDDGRKVDTFKRKLEEVNTEIAKFGENPYSNGFSRGFASVQAKLLSLVGVETPYARYGKLQNYRVSMADQQKNDAIVSATKEAVAKLNIKKKSDAELLALQKAYQGESQLLNRSMIRAEIAEELELRATAATAAREKAAEEEAKRAEENEKAQLSYKEGDNNAAIAQLQKQEVAYSSTIAYMEELLNLQRNREKYAKSDAEYQKIKVENDALERQIKLRTEVAIPKTERQIVEDRIADLEQEQLEIPISIGIEEAQYQFNILQDEIDGLKAVLNNNFPRIPDITPPDGSIAAYDAQLTKLAQEYANATNEVDRHNIALQQLELQTMRNAMTGDTSSEVQKLKDKAATLGELAARYRHLVPILGSYYGALQMVALGEATAAADAKKHTKDIADFGGQIKSQLGSALASSLGSLFEGLFDGNEEQSVKEKTQAILAPFADMVVQLGEYAIAMGIAGIALQTLATNPYLALAAGVALIALGKIAQAGIANITGGKNANVSNPTNFTGGGYSNGGNTSVAAMQLASPQSQSIVVKGEVSGSQLRFVLDKDEMRKRG